MTLIFHEGGPRHGHVVEVREEDLASGVLVYDGPNYFGVYEPHQAAGRRETWRGPAELWVLREQRRGGPAGHEDSAGLT